MPYDTYLVGGCVVVIFATVATLNALVERRKPWPGLICLLIGGGLIYWAWEISERTIEPMEAPMALYRIIAALL